MQSIVITTEQNEIFTLLSGLSENILNLIIPNSIYKENDNTLEMSNGVMISSKDKQLLLKSIVSMNDEKKEEIIIPDSIANILFTEFEVDGSLISPIEQAKFVSLMSTVDKENKNMTELYGKLDEMPDSIKKIVEPFMDIDGIKKIVYFLVGLYLLSALFTYLESIAMTDVANKFARKLRSKISTKINRLPLKYFDNHQAGDILSRVTNDVDTIAQSMNQSLSTLVSAITLFVGTIIMMFVTNWIMAITAIVSSLLGFVFMFGVLAKSQKYFVARQTELGNLNGHIEEVYSGLNVVKVYNGKKESDKKFDLYNQNVYEANRKSQFLSGLMMPMMNFVGNFGYVAVCIVGALLTMNGHISFGVIVAFISYVRLFISPLSQIAQAMTSLQSTAAASERVFEFVDEEEMSSEENIKRKLNKNKVKGKIEFKNVVFKYDGNEEPTIKDFSAIAKPGQKIAIVGPTGAGKTTMVNLLMKFYEINSGDIKIDDVSIKELTRENIHELFTMVLQDTWVFSGTVRENIVYNRKNISDERVKEVCKTVGLDHFIRTLPNGYDADISDNDSVSAGQRQLLTIARGMIEDAPFLILDEATSNVDTRTEELVQKAMDKLTEGKTSFIIAHRLSTIKNADLILVMKDGNIIEQGNHNELMKKNGFYAELYNSQFEL
ncbi:MAG: ABC transporter ATP-binding protein [Bacilli bacterium]|nr:ABC transporter ATP-binding protein [Bacilli bacterium]